LDDKIADFTRVEEIDTSRYDSEDNKLENEIPVAMNTETSFFEKP